MCSVVKSAKGGYFDKSKVYIHFGLYIDSMNLFFNLNCLFVSEYMRH